MNRGRALSFCLLLLLAVTTAGSAQEPAAKAKQAPATLVVRVLTDAQALQTAAYNLNYFWAADILLGRQRGQTPEAVGKAMGEIAAQSWNIPAGADRAVYFAQGMAANVQIWPGTSPTVVDMKPGAVTLRYNPAFYRKAFADKDMPSGVTVADFESFFQGLMTGLGERLGLQVTVTPEGDQSLFIVKQVKTPTP